MSSPSFIPSFSISPLSLPPSLPLLTRRASRRLGGKPSLLDRCGGWKD